MQEAAIIPKLQTDLLIDGQKLAAIKSSITYLETTHVPNYEFDTLKNRVTALEQQVTELKSTNEAVFKRLCALENRGNEDPATATGASGRVYRVGDVLIVPEMGTGTVVEVDPLDSAVPVRIEFEDTEFGLTWVDAADLDGAFKLDKN